MHHTASVHGKGLTLKKLGLYIEHLSDRFIKNNVENIVAKGEPAPFEQLLLLPQCCQNLSDAEASETDCMWDFVYK